MPTDLVSHKQAKTAMERENELKPRKRLTAWVKIQRLAAG